MSETENKQPPAQSSPERKKGQVVLHPILFGAYPAVFLYSANQIHFDMSVMILPALV